VARYGLEVMSADTPDRGRSGRGKRTALACAGVAAGVGAGVLAQRRRSRAIARNPEYRRLIEPLGGTELPVVSADGTRLHAIVLEPEPGPAAVATVVLAHGWTEQLSFWGPVIRQLRDRRLRIVAYDLRGHGSSSPAADGDYSIERFGEDLEAVLAAAGAPAGATIVAGHSLGGISIAAWAADHDVPARVAGAALVNTGVDDLIGGALVLGEIGKRLNPRWLSRAVLGSSAPLPPLSTPLEEAVIRYTAFGPTASTAQVAFYERMLMHTPASVRAATGLALSDLHLGSALAKLTVPTLVISGDRDRLTPPDHSRRIAAALPSLARLLELERTGHMAPLERPAEVADAIAALVATVVSGATGAAEPAAAQAGFG
jgi:pimeloyl-ACP methyl ester carboxylesterase